MLTRKYYQGIASILKQSLSKEHFIELLANYFEQDNPNFDPNKFKEAAGYGLEEPRRKDRV